MGLSKENHHSGEEGGGAGESAGEKGGDEKGCDKEDEGGSNMPGEEDGDPLRGRLVVLVNNEPTVDEPGALGRKYKVNLLS